MPIIGDFRHRAEIDGIRALAILPVLLFHAGFGCHGGYVGVDVFFVISGFLITALIWKDLESGRFTFGMFWERRARRIVPAMVVVTLAVLVVGWFTMPPADLTNLGQATTAQTVFGANIHYWRDFNYFSDSANEKPLLHTWSLAVEEQFYLVVPFLLWGLYRISALRRRTVLLALFALGWLLSFGVAVYTLKHHHQKSAFYLLPGRAWELLSGTIVAFLPVSPASLNRRFVREFAALLGLAAVIVPIFLYTKDTAFPGLAALPPCLGTALLIWANRRVPGGSDEPPTAVGRLLSLRPIVFVGLISYSLYLWHWPILAFSHFLILSDYARLSVFIRLLPLLAGVLFAMLSWKYVETPFRVRRLGATRKSMFTFAGAGLAALLAGGLLFTATKGFPHRLTPQALAFAAAARDGTDMRQMTAADVRAGKTVTIGVGNASQRPTFFLWGDSHAQAALPAVDAFLKERGVAGRAATHSSTPPVLGYYVMREYGLSRDSLDYNEAVFAYIQSQHIPNVLLAGRWDDCIGEGLGSDGKPRSLDAALLRTVLRLVAIGVHPWVMVDVPLQTFNVPRALSSSLYTPTYLAASCARATTPEPLQTEDSHFFAEVTAAGGQILDPRSAFLDPTGQYYRVEADNTALYSDNQHMTISGAKLLLLPLLRDELTTVR